MKHIVYRELGNHAGSPYQLSKIFDDETFEICEKQEADDGTSVSPHIIVRRDGHQVNLLSGDFIEAYDDERKARVEMGRLNDVNQIMEA